MVRQWLAGERFPAQLEDFPLGFGDRGEEPIAHHLDRLAALPRQAAELPFLARRLDDQDVAAGAGLEVARPAHAMEQLLELLAMRPARLAAELLDEIEAGGIDRPVGRLGVIDEHGRVTPSAS